MKKLLSIISVFVLMLMIVGCSEQTTATTGEVIKFDETQVKAQVIRVWMDDSEGVFMDEIIPAFEKLNPGIKVEFQHMGTVDIREKLKTYGKSGKGADVFKFPHDHMAQAILDDLVYVLPDALKTRLEKRIIPVALNIATLCYDDETGSFECAAGAEQRLFAVPISIESVTIYYNKALVQEADLPKTFEDFLADSAAYRAAHEGQRYFATGSHWADAYFLQGFYGAFGWTPFGPNLNDATQVGFEDPKSLRAMEWMINNLKPEVTGTGTHNSINGSTLFEEGKLPFILTGPWNVPQYLKAGIDLGNITLPSINGVNPKTFAGAQMVSVYKYSKNADAAMKFVEFLQTDQAAEILYRTSGDCPALKDEILATITGIKDDKLISVMLDQLSTSVPMPTIPEVTYYWGPAESMMKNIWNADGVIATEAFTAEKAYKASRDMAS
ncbi:MAG TPA: extracellular solute-binding protein [Bacilli bacterium]|nr:extracellular solute-binding protein [Bacilli bacterium]